MAKGLARRRKKYKTEAQILKYNPYTPRRKSADTAYNDLLARHEELGRRVGFLQDHLPSRLPSSGQIARMTEEERVKAGGEVASTLLRSVTKAFSLSNKQLKKCLREWDRECRDLLEGDSADADEWTKLTTLRHVLDKRSVSESDAGQILLAVGMAKLSGKMKLVRKALNTVIKSKIKITQDENGTYCDVEDTIRMMIKYHGLKEGDYDINYSGDGRDIAASTTTLCALRLVRLEGHSATAVTSLWPIAILSGSETYDFLAKATSTMRATLERVQKDGIYVDFGGVGVGGGGGDPDANCNITLWLSADLKFINIVTGLVPSNISQSCLYCHGGTDASAVPAGCCCQGTRHDPVRTWAIDRQADEALQRGRIRPNLFAFIPTTRVIVDSLHMFLRITDRLIMEACNLALVHEYPQPEVTTGKGKRKKVILPSQEDNGAEAAWLTDTFGSAFSKIAQCSITIMEGSKGAGWKVSRLNGNKRRLLMTQFKFSSVFKKNPAIGKRLQEAWDGFWSMYTLLNQKDPQLSIVNAFRAASGEEQLRVDSIPHDYDLPMQAKVAWDHLAMAWVGKITLSRSHGGVRMSALLPTTFIVPYVHIFAFHVGEVLRNVGSITDFSCQNLELANNLQGCQTFRANCRRPLEEAEMILLSSLRNLLNIPPIVTSGSFKRPYYCPFCESTGKQHSNVSIGHLRRHIRTTSCPGSEVRFTDAVELEVNAQSYTRYWKQLEQGQNEQVRIVREEARVELEVGQVERRRLTREARSARKQDVMAKKHYRRSQKVRKTAYESLLGEKTEKRARAIALALTVPDDSDRELQLYIAKKYGDML